MPPSNVVNADPSTPAAPPSFDGSFALPTGQSDAQTIASDGGGGLWIGTNTALLHLDRAAGTFTSYVLDKDPPGAPIISIAQGSSGIVWLGTLGGGLEWKDGGGLHRIDSRRGLYDDSISGILEDDSGRLWLSSSRGIFSVAPADVVAVDQGSLDRLPVDAYGTADGMAIADCDSGFGAPTAFRMSDGELWFTTSKGVVVVDPQHLRANRLAPPVVVESAVVDGATTDFGDVGDALTLAPGAQRIEIDYAALALAQPERVRFKYRLDGYDHDWIDASGARSAYYMNVPPGAYRFRVIACNEDGVWNDTGATLALTLRPRFFQTLGFRIGAAVAVLLLLVGLYALRVRSLVRQRQHLSDVIDERTRELTMTLASLREAQSDLVRAERMASVAALVKGIAHELNNPINYLAGNLGPLRRYSTALLQGAGRLADGKAHSADEIDQALRMSKDKGLAYLQQQIEAVLDDMTEGARRAGLIVGDLQNLTGGTQRALETIDLGRAITQSVALLGPRTPPGVVVRPEIGETPPIEVRAGNVEQLLVNLLDNALRAVKADGHVTVRAASGAGEVRLEVEDDGEGMDPATCRRACEPFFTTRAAGEGSGLGLSIVSTIVRDHHGRMEIDSAPGKGTTVRVWLPCPAANGTIGQM
jgi:signal transduction histidine kinase